MTARQAAARVRVRKARRESRCHACGGWILTGQLITTRCGLGWIHVHPCSLVHTHNREGEDHQWHLTR